MSEREPSFVEYPPTPPEQLVALLTRPEIGEMVESFQRQLERSGILDLYGRFLGRGEDYEKSERSSREIGRILFEREREAGELEPTANMEGYVRDFIESGIQARVRQRQTLHLDKPILPFRLLFPPVSMETMLGDMPPTLQFGLVKIDPSTGNQVPDSMARLFYVDFDGQVKHFLTSAALSNRQVKIVRQQHESLHKAGLVIPFTRQPFIT